MKRRRFMGLVWALAWFSGKTVWALDPSQGSEPPTLVLTLQECVETALKNNPDIVGAQYGVDIQDMAVQTVKGRLLPTITSGYSLSKAISGPTSGQFLDPVTGQIITSLGRSTVSGSHGVSASLRMPVYDAGTLADISASREGLRASEQDLRNVRLRTVTNVKRQFFEVLQAEKLLQLNLESVHTAEESLRRAQTMYEIGSAPLSDVLSARSNLETRKVDVIGQENAVDIARSNLAFTLGIDVGQPIQLKEGELSSEPLDLTPEQALARAIASRPDLKAQKARLEQSRRRLEITKAGIRKPSVSLNAGYSWSTRGDPFRGPEDLFLQNYNYSFGMSVSMTVFNGMSTENAVRQNRLQVLQGLEDIRQAERQASLQVKQAMLSLDRFRKQIEAQKEAVKAAEEDFRFAEERYNFGAGTILERLEAQERLFTSRNQYINAIYEFQKELANLEEAVGGF